MEHVLYTGLPSQEKTLTIEGNAAYRIEGDFVHISIDEIHNKLGNDTLSGTVSVELWALSTPYQGGDFYGQALAGTQIGELFGQHFLSSCSYQLVFQAPTAGQWYVCLMLREWENHGFMTRDYVNFSVPYVVDEPLSSKVTVSHSEKSNVIKVSFSDKGKMSEVEPVDMSTLDHIPSLITSKPDSHTVNKAKKAASPKKKNAEPVSINQAELETLQSIKGLTKNAAKGIIEGRPFKKLNDLLNVKGIGKKVLEKIRSQIKLN